MRLSVVVVNWNLKDELQACLRSLALQSHADLEIVVVDNGSTDGSPEMIEAEFPDVRLLRQAHNLGFAEGCNVGIEATTGPWVALVNNDAVADPDWAATLVRAAEACPADCGMLQSLLVYQQRPGTINSTGIVMSRSGVGSDRDEGRPVDGRRQPEEIFCPTAGAAAYRRSMLDAIKLPGGYFDRAYFMYCEDLDLGWRARLVGWSALYIPTSIVHHRWHGSSDRHGRSWLVVVSRTNRIRTLIKNASVPLLLRSAPKSAIEIAELAWHGRAKAVGELLGAIRESLALRPVVSAMARRERRNVERRWT